MPSGHENSQNDFSKKSVSVRHNSGTKEDFVLEKSIFSNIFEKDIRRVFIYKKAERLAKAIHVISPAFAESLSLKNRMDSIAVGLVDAAVLAPIPARTGLSRELLALSSVLGIARTSGMLSNMNAELIAKEAQLLLQEIAMYEEPRLFLDDDLSLADLAKRAGREDVFTEHHAARHKPAPRREHTPGAPVKDTQHTPKGQSDRSGTVLSVIRAKGTGVGIKDISTVIRDVSEKTIQRELTALVERGVLRKEGERRWSTYHLI